MKPTKERPTCDNPICNESLSCDPGDGEGYCSWECAGMTASGAAERIQKRAMKDAE